MINCNITSTPTTRSSSLAAATVSSIPTTVYTSSMEDLSSRQNASVMLLSKGSEYLAQGKHDEAMNAFDAAFQVLSSPATTATTFVNNNTIMNMAEWNEHNQPRHESQCFPHQQQQSPSSIVHTKQFSSSEDGVADCMKDTSSFSSNPNTPVDTYHEDECDVGPRPFQEAIVPDHVMMDVDVLQLIICYNQALVYHAKKECVLALQLYSFITGTIGVTMTTVNTTSGMIPVNTLYTLARLAMRAHNNIGQLEYAERSEEQAMIQFETALGYARKVPDTTASNQLEIATILSNWCRVQWMLGRVDDTVYQAMEEILRIRFNFLGWDHVDVASAHFNLGMAEYSRSCNEKALAHFMQYLQVSSHRLKSNKKVELDPIPGLIFVLLIKNDEKEDKISQDLVWGLRTLQDKRQDLGPKNSEVASVLNFIGTLLFHQKEMDHALLFFQEELRLEEQFMGTEEDVSVSVTCNNIGRILQELGRYPQAIYYYQRSLRHRYGEEFFGKSSSKNNKKNTDCNMSGSDDHSMVGTNNTPDEEMPQATMNLYSTVWYNLGLIHDKMGAFVEAIRAFRMSLKLRRSMLGRDHSDVACLLYNIGVLQMEQQLLNEATDSFREALRIRRVATTGQLNDRHVVKTLQKLSSLHKSKGNIRGALEACQEVMSVLKASVDFEWSSRNKNMGSTLREIAELYHAEGDLQLALAKAIESFNLLRSARLSNNETKTSTQDHISSIEQEMASLLLIGSLQHEGCSPMDACATFSEASRLILSSLIAPRNIASGMYNDANTATLLPLLEVSTMLAFAHCAPEA